MHAIWIILKRYHSWGGPG